MFGILLTLILLLGYTNSETNIIQGAVSLFFGYAYFFAAYVLIKKKRNLYRLIVSLLLIHTAWFVIESIFPIFGSITSLPQHFFINILIYLSMPVLVVIHWKLEPSQAITPNNQIREKVSDAFTPLQYQGVLIRAEANLIDQLIVVVPLILIYYLLGHTIEEKSLAITGGLLLILYCSVTERLYGQTVGKKILGIKVMMVDGRPCTITGALIRNFGRILDVILGSYILGIICIILTKRKQRIGDLLAHTVVVKP